MGRDSTGMRWEYGGPGGEQNWGVWYETPKDSIKKLKMHFNKKELTEEWCNFLPFFASALINPLSLLFLPSPDSCVLWSWKTYMYLKCSLQSSSGFQWPHLNKIKIPWCSLESHGPSLWSSPSPHPHHHPGTSSFWSLQAPGKAHSKLDVSAEHPSPLPERLPWDSDFPDCFLTCISSTCTFSNLPIHRVSSGCRALRCSSTQNSWNCHAHPAAYYTSFLHHTIYLSMTRRTG